MNQALFVRSLNSSHFSVTGSILLAYFVGQREPKILRLVKIRALALSILCFWLISRHGWELEFGLRPINLNYILIPGRHHDENITKKCEKLQEL